MGGGDDDGLLLLIKAELCNLDSNIEIITTATRDPERTGNAYMQAFKDLGCGNARYLQIDEANPADAPRTLERLRKANVLFFTGGNQMRLSAYLSGTDFLELTMRKLKTEASFVVAGTSAGACAMSNRMIFEGSGADAMLIDEIKVTGGLGLVRNLFIDTHFTERGRFGRLAQAVTRHPSCLGVGLAEGTGILIEEGRKIKVFGSGNVTIMDGSQIKYTNLDEAGSGDPIAVENLIVHFLVQGHEFHLEQHAYKARMRGVKLKEENQEKFDLE